ARKCLYEVRLDRERHAKLGYAQSKALQILTANSQVPQCLHKVVIRLAGRHDAQPCALARSESLIYSVDACELARRLDAPVIHFLLERQREWNNQSRVGALLISRRNRNFRLFGIETYNAAAITYVRHHLHCDP